MLLSIIYGFTDVMYMIVYYCQNISDANQYWICWL